MSAPFSPDNRHHLLLTEAHQVNEFLDARLVGAEVPEEQRLDAAVSALELALLARRSGAGRGSCYVSRVGRSRFVMPDGSKRPAEIYRVGGQEEQERCLAMEARLSDLAKQHPRAAEALLRIFAANPTGGGSVYLPLWGTSDGSGASAQTRQSCS